MTEIHISSFKNEYKTALVFSMIEGLMLNESIRLICLENPHELNSILKDANLKFLKWTVQSLELNKWEIILTKTAEPSSIGD